MIHHHLQPSATPGGSYPPKWGIDIHPLNRVETAKPMKSNNLIFFLSMGEGVGGHVHPPQKKAYVSHLHMQSP